MEPQTKGVTGSCSCHYQCHYQSNPSHFCYTSAYNNEKANDNFWIKVTEIGLNKGRKKSQRNLFLSPFFLVHVEPARSDKVHQRDRIRRQKLVKQRGSGRDV